MSNSSTELPQGIYEIYEDGPAGLQPLGIKSVNGFPDQVVVLPAGHQAPLWTVRRVATNTFTFSLGDAFVAPTHNYVMPSSTAYGWKVTRQYSGNGPRADMYTIQRSDGSGAWAYLVGGGRRGLVPFTPIGDLEVSFFGGSGLV
ncbi:hypothetical protein LshimejAT787_0507020 [Lyophyllum shimeji]|uniref:Uncharacterized protein n=1 Tax=Lyophyllum shimeji TaxID=47721 RepID=A0A9P3PP41_LYOSH|nr:hypothetical protein LshimejAT787_0507020 [Lyophyllum shimeji]